MERIKEGDAKREASILSTSFGLYGSCEKGSSCSFIEPSPWGLYTTTWLLAVKAIGPGNLARDYPADLAKEWWFWFLWWNRKLDAHMKEWLRSAVKIRATKGSASVMWRIICGGGQTSLIRERDKKFRGKHVRVTGENLSSWLRAGLMATTNTLMQ